ncbi:hypothetical protein Pelo_7041 [Pelomyxa schiedti]|nr:hypothetical protein Pelo_7041 [Pelomyxa schiedti]
MSLDSVATSVPPKSYTPSEFVAQFSEKSWADADDDELDSVPPEWLASEGASSFADLSEAINSASPPHESASEVTVTHSEFNTTHNVSVAATTSTVISPSGARTISITINKRVQGVYVSGMSGALTESEVRDRFMSIAEGIKISLHNSGRYLVECPDGTAVENALKCNGEACGSQILRVERVAAAPQNRTPQRAPQPFSPPVQFSTTPKTPPRVSSPNNSMASGAIPYGLQRPTSPFSSGNNNPYQQTYSPTSPYQQRSTSPMLQQHQHFGGVQRTPSPSKSYPRSSSPQIFSPQFNQARTQHGGPHTPPRVASPIFRPQQTISPPTTDEPPSPTCSPPNTSPSPTNSVLTGAGPVDRSSSPMKKLVIAPRTNPAPVGGMAERTLKPGQRDIYGGAKPREENRDKPVAQDTAQLPAQPSSTPESEPKEETAAPTESHQLDTTQPDLKTEIKIIQDSPQVEVTVDMINECHQEVKLPTPVTTTTTLPSTSPSSPSVTIVKRIPTVVIHHSLSPPVAEPPTTTGPSAQSVCTPQQSNTPATTPPLATPPDTTQQATTPPTPAPDQLQASPSMGPQSVTDQAQAHSAQPKQKQQQQQQSQKSTPKKNKSKKPAAAKGKPARHQEQKAGAGAVKNPYELLELDSNS